MIELEKGQVPPNNDNGIQLSDLWNLCRDHWWWFIVSVALCISAAVLYIASTPKIYTRSASIMIKDDGKGNTIGELSAFKDLEMLNVNMNINNEIEIFGSPLIMNEVVRRLNLHTSYYFDHLFLDEDLYTRSPLTVAFPDTNDSQSFSFYIERRPGMTVRLSRFARNGAEVPEWTIVEGALSDTLLTPVGRVVVSPTLYYNDNFASEIHVVRQPLESVAGGYAARLTAALLGKQTSIVQLTVSDVSTQRAEDILNTLIDVYEQEQVLFKNKAAVNTSRFINERLEIIEKELGGIDTDIEQYKSEHKIIDPQSAAAAVLSESGKYASQSFEVNSQLALARYIKEYLSDQSKALSLLPVNTGLKESNLEGQIGEYNMLLMQRDKLLANSSENNPMVIDLNHSLDAMRQAIHRSVDNLIVTLELQVARIEEQESQIMRRISFSSEQEKHLLSIERQQKIKEALYLYLLQKREENELSSAITVSNTRVISPARGRNVPISPQKSLILVAALIIGIVLPAVILFLREMLNTTVRGRKDLSILTIPFLGEIPLVGLRRKKGSALRKDIADKQRETKLVVESKGHNAVNEAFRIVRTNFDFMQGKGDGCKVAMFTSFNPGSGKTFTSINLAMTMALKGKRVIVLDLDMRKASLSCYVNSPKTGISSYLSGQSDSIASLIVRGEIHPCLDVIPVGAIPPNPAELLLDGRLETLLHDLRAEYDYIFIDCPPVDLVADASIIGKYADLTIFVIREGLMDRRMLPEVEELYKANRFSNMAVVLNGSCYSVGKYGYRRYGYHYHYYSNGYYGSKE